MKIYIQILKLNTEFCLGIIPRNCNFLLQFQFKQIQKLHLKLVYRILSEGNAKIIVEMEFQTNFDEF